MTIRYYSLRPAKAHNLTYFKRIARYNFELYSKYTFLQII